MFWKSVCPVLIMLSFPLERLAEAEEQQSLNNNQSLKLNLLHLHEKY